MRSKNFRNLERVAPPKKGNLVILACQAYCLHLMEEQSQFPVSGSELPDALRNTASMVQPASMAENHAIFSETKQQHGFNINSFVRYDV